MIVKAEVVRSHQGELQITYPGRIKAAADVDLAFRVAGPILRMPAEIGRFVRKGTVLAEIDPRDYEIQLKATEAEYNQIKAEAERVIELYNRKSVPVNDYDKAVSGLQQISAKYAAHTNALRDTRLLAPFDGYIQKKYFDANETVAAGIPVISMINTNYFEVEIDIPSVDYVRQDLFRKFSCVADVFPGETFPLELIDIAKKANLNQLYRVRLRLKPDTRVALAAGMSVNVVIDYGVDGTSLMEVPLEAIFEEKGNSAVWIYRPETKSVERRNVQIRQILKNGKVVIDKGLDEGEMVVTAGVHKLKEGMKVELLKPVPATNIGGLL
ncbi:MAG: efflux RND transporter periplasmic adaptor subunit [Odoribacter sp.]